MAFTSQVNPLILLEKQNDSNKIIFQKNNLKAVLSQVKKLPVCVISIAAHASQGSSLLLGYFLQYLQLLEEENDIEEPNVLHPFAWKEGQQPSEDQVGTWIVNKPFVINDSAVILLYSQCSENEFYSEETAMNTLVGLDLHISCLTIIISSDKLSLEFLSKMATFIKFGKTEAETNFKKELAFFVPNWTMVSRYPLGGEGGQKLFRKMLDACPDDVQEDISKHFNTIYTHLAPKSGELKTFKGNLEELDPSFVESMDFFVGGLLNSEAFQNQILTEKVFKKTLYSFLKKTDIISEFETDSDEEAETEIRQPSMMLLASNASSEELYSEAKEHTEKALDFAANEYLQAMEKALSQGVRSSFFIDLHNQSREKCLEQLEEDLGAEWENDCEERLDEMLRPVLEILQDKYHIVSNSNQEEKQESNPIAEIELASEKAVKYYEQEMKKLIENGPYKEEILDGKNEQLVEDICKKYMDYLNSLNIAGTLEEYEEKLRNGLCTIYFPLRTENAQMFEVSITEIKGMSVICLKEYQSIMSQELSNVQSAEELQSLHEAAYHRAMMLFRTAHLEQHDPDFVQNNMIELKNAIDSAFEEILELYELKMAKEAGNIAGELRKCRQFYEDEMDKHFRSNEFIKMEELKKLHQRVSETALKTVPNLTEEQKLDLESRMEEIYMKYVELNAMNSQDQPAIGIDLGTTYCCTAIYTKGKVHVVRNGIGKNTTPSYVAFKNGKEIVGDAAKRQAFSNPENTIFDAKRIIGRKFGDPKLQEDMRLWPFSVVDEQGIPKIAVGDRNLHPEEISAKLLKQLKLDAEAYLGEKVTKAVITVPAYFTDGQRQATIDAGTMAGLNVLSIIAEPTAAALAYKLQHSFENRERNVLIFDLGGGTFDVVVMKTSKGKIDVLAVDGDTHLGGEDFDKKLMEHCAVEFKKQHNINLFDGKDSKNKQKKDEARRKLKRLQGECEKRKVELAAARLAEVNVDNMHGDIDLNVMVTRKTFEELNATLFQKTIEIVEKVLESAKLDKSKIEDIVLVGGSTRIPKIQELLKNYFGGKTLDCSINPDEAVAYGAAMHAAMLNGLVGKDSVEYEEIQDVAPMSIGLQMYGGGFSVIIPKSTKTPVKAKERYRTAHDNQTSVQITIYQGEDKVAAKNEKLGDFYLNGIPPREAGKENVDVEMMINSQGILNVTAVSLSTGIREVSVIENKMRLGKEAIDNYLLLERLSYGK